MPFLIRSFPDLLRTHRRHQANPERPGREEGRVLGKADQVQRGIPHGSPACLEDRPGTVKKHQALSLLGTAVST